MPRHHIAGAAVAVVKNGEIFLSRGYGYADLARKIKVNPESTLFPRRIDRQTAYLDGGDANGGTGQD